MPSTACPCIGRFFRGHHHGIRLWEVIVVDPDCRRHSSLVPPAPAPRKKEGA